MKGRKGRGRNIKECRGTGERVKKEWERKGKEGMRKGRGKGRGIKERRGKERKGKESRKGQEGNRKNGLSRAGEGRGEHKIT